MTYEILDLGDVHLQSKRCIRNAVLAYKTFGTLNAAKDNAIIYPTSFAATHDDAAWLIGTAHALDPDKYFIIVPDAFGNGLSSSPSNTPAPHDGSRFPHVTIHDNVVQQHRLLTEVRHRPDQSRHWLVTGRCASVRMGLGVSGQSGASLHVQSAARTSRHFHLFFDSVRAAIELDADFREGFTHSSRSAVCVSLPAFTRHGAFRRRSFASGWTKARSAMRPR